MGGVQDLTLSYILVMIHNKTCLALRKHFLMVIIVLSDGGGGGGVVVVAWCVVPFYSYSCPEPRLFHAGWVMVTL